MKKPMRKQQGFTLLEVMIAMSILAIGSASILGTFVAAVRWQAMRVENNRITAIYNHARQHAEVLFNQFDPTAVKEGEPLVPKTVIADLADPEALRSPDPQIREAADKFEGFRYEIEFESNEFAVAGSSVVVNIKIYGLSGKLADSPLSMKEILTRSGTPVQEYWTSPSKERQSKAANRGDKGG